MAVHQYDQAVPHDQYDSRPHGDMTQQGCAPISI